jgi:hypothetical protein
VKKEHERKQRAWVEQIRDLWILQEETVVRQQPLFLPEEEEEAER